MKNKESVCASSDGRSYQESAEDSEVVTQDRKLSRRRMYANVERINTFRLRQ